MKFLIVAFACLLTLSPRTSHATFLPLNSVRDVPLAVGDPQITKEIFDQRIKDLQVMFAPIMKHFGGRLSIKGDWKNKQINAYASQLLGSWKVIITGALAQRPELSPDGMTLIVCHEVGHHLGGFPFTSGPISSWAAVEGQADYFSTQICARKMWESEREENAKFELKVAAIPRVRCDLSFDKLEDRHLCYRTSVGLESVINTMAVLVKKPMPQYDTPDPKVVTDTLESHPAVQCRFDTLYNGAICPVTHDDTIIPGKKVRGGRRGVEAETEAAMNSCSLLSKFDFGLRPKCWFKPTM